ncbi:glutathione peroxidase [Cohnella thailandensis]|uniref:Glutathione peroxidase n=1 Tax=Cohnella thailandensis TaxID=557557 RepID=A0A841SXH7_9BACL|nr:glutathione peroxidase [Cohnella thailandensis]MBB6636943.1 glutathione peroxidase [Cohnella thailandensis]MBP1973174.1 glutathione peroxidase [Cohnella thailandensis]
MSVYDYKVKTIRGTETTLGEYAGKVLLIVNTASKCGLTPQYEGLQKLYETYKDRGLVILGFPSNQFMGQEPDSEEKIEEFCTLNYGVTFPMFEKTEVIGDNAHPLFQYLTGQGPADEYDIKWNFAKFIVDREGNVVERIDPTVKPEEFESKLAALL